MASTFVARDRAPAGAPRTDSITDPRLALEAVARLAVPLLCDWCVVSTVDAAGRLTRITSLHSDPALEDVMRELRERYPPDARRSSMGEVLRSGEPKLIPRIDDGYIRKVARDARHAELLHRLDPRSVMYLPLHARGTTIGVLTLASATRDYGESDVPAGMQFADRAALTLDNLRLFRATLEESALRRVAEQRLRQTLPGFRMLFAANPLPMWVYDPVTLRFLEVNDAAVGRYGYTRDEFLSMTLEDIRDRADVPALHEDLRRAREALQDAGIWRHRLKDGSEIEVHIRSHTLERDGRSTVLVVGEDVTERLRAERALQELNAELEERVASRTAELATANRELEAFSYSVSHDLRAPLRSIDGFSQALVEDLGDAIEPAAREHLRRIRAGAQRMAELIDDLLRLSRINRYELAHEAVDLTGLARAVAAELRQHEPDRDVTIRIADHLAVEGDRRLLRLMLENLIGNAWKFTRRKSGARIDVGAELHDDAFMYFVRDNGAGFDMRYADKLFGVFQRLHPLTEFEGTGIGLAIVQRIVIRHGGAIAAFGEIGKGATFHFELP
ncbi:MAG: sensor histidine kinase [Longimicrobiales bacterium]